MYRYGLELESTNYQVAAAFCDRIFDLAVAYGCLRVNILANVILVDQYTILLVAKDVTMF